MKRLIAGHSTITKQDAKILQFLVWYAIGTTHGAKQRLVGKIMMRTVVKAREAVTTKIALGEPQLLLQQMDGVKKLAVGVFQAAMEAKACV
ncbi:hypothetical protein HYY70_02980 [Candidatus Woesearchaeota archaeon]|nr:hypothetical protein [Candidatus Woesearchaeota archaeon]